MKNDWQFALLFGILVFGLGLAAGIKCAIHEAIKHQAAHYHPTEKYIVWHTNALDF